MQPADMQVPPPADWQTFERHLLHDKKVLVLADNARDAAQVRPLLPPPGCLLLVAARTRFTLPGLAAIDLDCRRSSPCGNENVRKENNRQGGVGLASGIFLSHIFLSFHPRSAP